MTGKVKKVLLYTCKDYAIPSRNNETDARPRKEYDGNNHRSIMRAFEDFTACVERCKLVLELDNGLEISLVPTLQEDCPAFGEPGCGHDTPVRWDISVEVWPR